MSNEHSRTSQLTQWAIYNLSAWYLSIIVTIVLSYAIVNLFHPEETNLLIGFSAGLCVGLGQYFLLRKLHNISIRWIIAHALGIGIPYAIGTLVLEGDIVVNSLSNTVIAILTYAACGLLSGLFLIKPFKKISSSPVLTTILYSLIWVISLWSIMWGGLIFVFDFNNK